MVYVELHARSAFSFLEGSSLPEELASRCGELEMPAMALLDRDGVSGAPRFHLAAQKLGIRAHIGAEVTSMDGIRYPLLAENRTGYLIAANRLSAIQRMESFISHHRLPTCQGDLGLFRLRLLETFV